VTERLTPGPGGNVAPAPGGRTRRDAPLAVPGPPGAPGIGTDGGAPRFADYFRRTLKTSETVAHDIVAEIVARDLQPGDRLPLEATMQASYRVSRASLREALRLLEVQGLISIKPGPGGGPVVGTVDARYLARTSALYYNLGGSSYREVFDVQLLLEPLAAEAAARNPDRGLVTAVLAPLLPALHPLDGAAWYQSAFEFHHAVYLLSGNRVQNLITQSVAHIVADHVLAIVDVAPIRAEIARDHVAIGTAIVEGRAVDAGRLMRSHFQFQLEYCEREVPARMEELIEWR